jgi:hypothetical protein
MIYSGKRGGSEVFPERVKPSLERKNRPHDRAGLLEFIYD